MSKQNGRNLSVVGQYNDQFNNILGIALPCSKIFQSDGLIMHIVNKHPGYAVYANKISDIINCPDFIGCHPTIPNSIELVKKLDKNILVAIKLDSDDGYLYVSSLYNVSEYKIQQRLNSGRLKLFK